MVKIFDDNHTKIALDQNLKMFADLSLSMTAYRLRDDFTPSQRAVITEKYNNKKNRITTKLAQYPHAVLLSLFPDRSKINDLEKGIEIILIQHQEKKIEIIHNHHIDTEDIMELEQIIAKVMFGYYFKRLPKAERLYRKNIQNLCVNAGTSQAFTKLKMEKCQAVSDKTPTVKNE